MRASDVKNEMLPRNEEINRSKHDWQLAINYLHNEQPKTFPSRKNWWVRRYIAMRLLVNARFPNAKAHVQHHFALAACRVLRAIEQGKEHGPRWEGLGFFGFRLLSGMGSYPSFGRFN